MITTAEKIEQLKQLRQHGDTTDSQKESIDFMLNKLERDQTLVLAQEEHSNHEAIVDAMLTPTETVESVDSGVE